MCTYVDLKKQGRRPKNLYVYKVLRRKNGILGSLYEGKSTPPGLPVSYENEMPYAHYRFVYALNKIHEIREGAITIWPAEIGGLHMALEGFHVYLSREAAEAESAGHVDFPVALVRVSPKDFLFLGVSSYDNHKVATYSKIRLVKLLAPKEFQ